MEHNTDQSETQVCKQCRQAIPDAASRCYHCGSVQDWRSWLSLSNTSLALIIALISILSVSINQIRGLIASDQPDIKMILEEAVEDEATFIARNEGLMGGVVRIQSFSVWPLGKTPWSIQLFDKGHYIEKQHEKSFQTSAHKKTSEYLCEHLNSEKYFEKFGLKEWTTYDDRDVAVFTSAIYFEMTKGLKCDFTYSVTPLDGSKIFKNHPADCEDVDWVKYCMIHVMTMLDDSNDEGSTRPNKAH